MSDQDQNNQTTQADDKDELKLFADEEALETDDEALGTDDEALETDDKQEAQTDSQQNLNDTEEKIEAPEVQEVEVQDPNLVRIAKEDNDKAHWYVVHTYSGREMRVAETLKQRAQTLNLDDQIIKILIPTKEKIQIRKGQRKNVREKIFPGYMMVNMIMSDEAWLAVRTTQGVTGFVGASSKPSPIAQHEIEAIYKYSQQVTPQYKAEFTEGEAVKITSGPFAEFLGTVESIDESKGQVKVLINIFGRETPVELDFLQVEKV